MIATKHIGERMSQRGMTNRMIELVMEFGKEQGDKVILNRKATQSILHEMDQLKKRSSQSYGQRRHSRCYG